MATLPFAPLFTIFSALITMITTYLTDPNLSPAKARFLQAALNQLKTSCAAATVVRGWNSKSGYPRFAFHKDVARATLMQLMSAASIAVRQLAKGVAKRQKNGDGIQKLNSVIKSIDTVFTQLVKHHGMIPFTMPKAGKKTNVPNIQSSKAFPSLPTKSIQQPSLNAVAPDFVPPPVAASSSDQTVQPITVPYSFAILDPNYGWVPMIQQ